MAGFLPTWAGQRSSKNLVRATQNPYVGQMWSVGHGLDTPALD